MTTRRSFLTGILATGLAPRAGWAEAGDPAFLAAARQPSGGYALFGLGPAGETKFEIPLPGRGHAAAAHPSRPLAVAFARRPGAFALVIDCAAGVTQARLEAPEGYHFYGHGAFSADGALLFTTENDFANARGMIGIWDARRGFRRMGAVPSGGVGPHEMRRMPGEETLVVANGGIETHPDSGRAKLNLPFMRPNLSYLSFDGEILEHHEPPGEWHKASMRHLAVRADGRVAVACQWQGDPAESAPLLATHARGNGLAFHHGAPGLERDMRGYAGSIAFSGPGKEIAITGPRGGLAAVFGADGGFERLLEEADICGVANAPGGFMFTTGTGRIMSDGTGGFTAVTRHDRAWDNHLVSVAIPSLR